MKEAIRALIPRPARPAAFALKRQVSAGIELANRWGPRALERRRLSRIETGGYLTFRGSVIRVNDPANVRVLCRDLFDHHIYGFTAEREDPKILDLGSNIGMSIVYFKHLYPRARIVAFEADPAIYPYLEENVKANGLRDVELVQAAVTDRAGTLTFDSDAKYGSRLADPDEEPPPGWRRYEVPSLPLASVLSEQFDYLKMNIEGAEAAAIASAGDALRAVRELVIEYHHLPGLPRTLHILLSALHDQGFDYLVHDYYGTRRGPFLLSPETRAFPLVHARRID